MTLHEQYQAALTEFRNLSGLDSWTPEQEARATELRTTMERLQGEIGRDNSRIEARNAAAAHDAFLNGTGSNDNSPIEHNGSPSRGQQSVELRQSNEQMQAAVAVARRSGRTISNNETAFRMGMFLRAALGGNSEARSFCRTQGIELRTTRQTENENSGGGFLVPTEFDNEILDVRERYGLIRGMAKTKGMKSDTRKIKRKEGGLEAYAVGEGKKGTVSKTKWGEVELKARRFVVIARMTSELNEDSAIDMANDFVDEMGQAFAKKEDLCGFIGDGTAPYHGIMGIVPKLLSLNNDKSKIGGLQIASGDAWDEITRADLLGLMGRAPSYVFDGSPAWICSSQFYFNVFERLIEQAGGTTRFEMVNGKPTYFYKGFPIRFTSALPSVSTASTVPLLFGDTNKGVIFGDRRGITIATTDQATVEDESLFESEELAVRASERFDIVFDDAGNADADAAKRKGGAVVGLLTAAA